MYILIPTNGTDKLKSTITSIIDLSYWALIDFTDGEVKSTKFFENREDITDIWIDFAILDNKYENYMDLMNEGVMCLVRRKEESIEELIEAFKFKELDEIGL